MSRRYDNDPGADLAAISALALIVLAVVTGIAFFAVDGGVLGSEAGASLHVLSSSPPAPRETAQADAQEIDRMTTASTMTAAADVPVCDMELCTRSYRSFRPSDCTFQPFDGPRRLCTR